MKIRGKNRRSVIDVIALQENERYSILIENTNDIIYSLDSEGNFTFIGPQAKRYGFDPKEVISQKFLNFVHPKDRERMLLEFQKNNYIWSGIYQSISN